MRRALTVTTVAVAVVLGGTGLAWAAATTAVSPWTVQAAPMLPKENAGNLTGVSCAQARQCIAAGDPAEVWNGTAWVPRGIRAGGDPVSVGAVSCPARASCVAVGVIGRNDTSVAVSWNGTTWTIMPGSQLPSTQLAGVSCVSVSDCVAVGYSVGGIGTVAMSWNGSTWTVDPTQTAQDDQLGAVSCASATSCLAISSPFSADRLLAEEWNGSVWTVLPDAPVPAGATYPGLFGVSCASAAECMVVGGSGIGNGLLADLWNGSAWVSQTVPSSKSGGLWGVSCPAVGHCTAVGQTQAAAVVEAWNGARWTQQRGVTPPAGAKELYRLQAISCTAPHTCEAVGLIIPRAGSGHRYATPLAAGE